MSLLRTAVLAILCFVLPCFTPHAEAVSGKKVLIGIGMMAGGAALVAHATRCILRDCGDVEGVIGFAVFGAGTGVLIWGLASHPHHESKFEGLPSSRLQHYALEGGIRLRW